MQILLAMYLAVALAGLLLPVSLGLPAGLSIENAVLGAVTMALIYRVVLVRMPVPPLATVIAPFVCWVAYAFVSWALVTGVIKYERYDGIKTVTPLVGLLQQLVVFMAFSLAPRNRAEAFRLLKFVLACGAIANVITVLSAFGALPVDIVAFREDGRNQGVMGQANQHGIFAAVFLPALVIQSISERGARRLLWSIGALSTLAAMLIVASRGAFVGLSAGLLTGMALLRREISLRQLVAPTIAILGVTALVVVLLSFQFGDFFQDRFIDDSSSADMSDVSSGRVDFWTDAMARMMKTPITLVTGFGWQVYWSLPHVKSPHNTYLTLWFNLGIPGLVCFLLIFAKALRLVMTSLRQSRGVLRRHQFAFVIAVMSLLAWLFFGELYTPWPFIWSYIGLVLNLSAELAETDPAALTEPATRKHAIPSLGRVRRDRYGWSVRGVSRTVGKASGR